MNTEAVMKKRRFSIPGIAKDLFKAILGVLAGEREKRHWEDDLEPEGEGLIGAAQRFAGFMGDYILMVVTGGVILAFVLYFSVMVLGHPNFLAGALADMLVWMCRSGASCEFNVLYPAFAFANIFLLSIYVSVVVMARRIPFEDQHQDAVVLGERLEDIWAELETIKKSREWISVKDVLPEDDTEVWVCYGKNTFVAWREQGTWYAHGEEEPDEVNVSYWMPLPQPVDVKGEKDE